MTANDAPGAPADDPDNDPGAAREAAIPLGVVIRRQPGVTRWARWVWRPVAVLPGAPPADWRELRRDGDAVEYHAATVTLRVHRKETEGYRVALSNEPPAVYVILRPSERADAAQPVTVFGATASAFEAQDHLDSGEDEVEAVPMPPDLIAWLSAFVGRHHVDAPFFKRRRRDWSEGDGESGRGDPRVAPGDVYRAPTGRKR